MNLMLAAAATFFLIVIAGESYSASACSCGVHRPGSLRCRRHCLHRHVGGGRDAPGEAFSSDDPERFIFDVGRVYKGDALVRQTIVTAREGASCGLEITGPGPFLVFATTTDSIVTGAAEDELYSNLCSGTRATASGAVPSAFGAGRPPSEDAAAENGAAPAPTNDDRDSSFPHWGLLALVVAATGVAGVVLARRRPRNTGG